MFENLVSQDASQYIISDIRKGVFPGAVLFSGPDASGKLTAALEVARVLSCTNKTKKGSWDCDCPSCSRQRSLTCTNLLLMGPRECALEFEAAKDTFITAYKENAKYINAARYLYLRSIRKLTLRFNGILYKGEKDLNKIGGLIEQINELLEQLDFPRDLPSAEELEKICLEINKFAIQLESEYLYNSIPINQVRNMEDWAFVKTEEGKKTVIIENADRMQNNVRNALLKILEEPPADCIFILMTSRRNAVLPTILSRVRNYNFNDRSADKQKEVISRVFHNENFNGSISDYLLDYLPVPAADVRQKANDFITEIVNGKIPEVATYVKDCGGFKPKIEFRIFLSQIMACKKKLLLTPEGCAAAVELVKVVQATWDNTYSFNQSIQGALEYLVREISRINQTYGKIITQALR